MLRHLLLIFIFISFARTGAAQSGITLSYPGTTNEDLVMMMRLMDIKAIDVKLQGELKNKKAVLTEYIVDGLQITSKNIEIHPPMPSDTIIVKAMASKISKDRFKLNIGIKGTFYSDFEIDLPDDFHILMETRTAPETGPEIPIFAYTTGIKEEKEYEGRPQSVINYCRLRDSKIHPRSWYEECGIANYVYFTISFK